MTVIRTKNDSGNYSGEAGESVGVMLLSNRNSILMTHHHSDLGRASDWSCRVGNLLQPIRSTAQIWVVTRHQYGISALVSQTSFRGETSCGVVKCRASSQAKAREQVGFSRA